MAAVTWCCVVSQTAVAMDGVHRRRLWRAAMGRCMVPRNTGGITNQNDWSGFGSLFRLNKDGSGYAILHRFASSAGDGRNPSGELIEGTDGALYGVTSSGGIISSN